MLSRRETQVVSLVAEGHPNKVIADILGMSAHTAKFHIKNIMRKLNAGSRAHAATKYLQQLVGSSALCAECAARRARDA